MKSRSISATGAAAIAAFIALAEIRPAQADETVRVRGTIASSRGDLRQDPRRTETRRWRLNLNGR